MFNLSVRPVVVVGLLLLAVAYVSQNALAMHDHSGAAATSQPAKAQFKGDPYLLTTDPVGDKLPDKPVIYDHEGRELRFASEKNVETFKADPSKYLPKVDEAMIAQQKPFYPLDTCPVTGDKLGGDMGKPVDFIYKNRLVRFCCNDCPKEFAKDPAKYIAKIDAAVIAKQGAAYPLTTCPVSDEKLGGDMGEAKNVVIGNRLVKLCCNGCVKDLYKNPLKYLAAIDAAAEKHK